MCLNFATQKGLKEAADLNYNAPPANGKRNAHAIALADRQTELAALAGKGVSRSGDPRSAG